MDTKSICYVTRNENGTEQLEFEYELDFFERLMQIIRTRSFNVPKIHTETWVLSGVLWVDKGTRVPAHYEKQRDLSFAKIRMKNKDF
jgi:hypothetical protein